MSSRRNQPYKDGELEIILSLVPTQQNIDHLSALLGRSKSAIEIVYRIAYQEGPFGQSADTQQQKIRKAKRAVGIVIGRRTKPS